MLKEIRERRGMSQNSLAKESGVQQGVISYIESGRTKAPRVDTLQALANALECTVDELIKPAEEQAERKEESA